MKVKNLQALLANINPEMDVFASDPDRSGIVWEIEGGRIVTVESEKQFGAGEFASQDFPIGFEFLKLY